MKENDKGFSEELVMKVFHPDRITRLSTTYVYEFKYINQNQELESEFIDYIEYL
jgi:hypothetical protein